MLCLKYVQYGDFYSYNWWAQLAVAPSEKVGGKFCQWRVQNCISSEALFLAQNAPDLLGELIALALSLLFLVGGGGQYRPDAFE